MERKMVSAEDSRAIAADMDNPPFTTLTTFEQMEIRKMYGYEILTYVDYLFVRERYLERQKENLG
jgi:hypothetical protein